LGPGRFFGESATPFLIGFLVGRRTGELGEEFLLVFGVVPVYVTGTWWAEDPIFGKKLHSGDWLFGTGIGDLSDGVVV
jgi:hypothetical protein